MRTRIKTDAKLGLERKTRSWERLPQRLGLTPIQKKSRGIILALKPQDKIRGSDIEYEPGRLLLARQRDVGENWTRGRKRPISI